MKYNIYFLYFYNKNFQNKVFLSFAEILIYKKIAYLPIILQK